MSNFNTFLLVGIAVGAIIAVAPVAVPLLENLMNFMPRRY